MYDDGATCLTSTPVRCSKSDRLDWMYQGGMQARQEADQRLEAAGAGEAASEQQQQQELPSVVCG